MEAHSASGRLRTAGESPQVLGLRHATPLLVAEAAGCGTVKAKLGLSERTYQCDHCGLAIDRDTNAARNLLKLAASGAEQNAREGTVRPRTVRHVR